MKKFKDKQIEELKTDIYLYGNTRYRLLTHDNEFSDKRLRELWYGTSDNDFCVRTMNDYESKCNSGIYSEEWYIGQLKKLRDDLKEAFSRFEQQ